MATSPLPIRTVAPADSELVRLYNQTDRAFTHGLTLADERHTVIQYKLAAHSFGKVAPEVASMWLEWFPNQVVTAEEAVTAVQGARKEADVAKEQLAEAQKKIEELQAKLPKESPAPKSRKKDIT